MSSTPLQDLPLQGASSASVQTLTSRTLLQPTTDPSASRRVCFYKSGDTQFGGHRMVINGRTFKTFDALLDTLSKKVPLPFGVRTITTPRGTRPVKTLEDLHDGGSYVCSDQKRVKPINLDLVNRRQVPWNTTRLVSAGRRRQRGVPSVPLGRRNEGVNRPSRMSESRTAVRTPKRLVVFKNRDPNVWRTIILHKRTAPSYEALLDYLSQVLQFRVVKLYTPDGRRVDGLPGLILCSGVIVASGNEHFRPGNYDPQRSSQMAQQSNSESVEASRLQPLTHGKKSFSSGTRSRNFSLSSERGFVNQINKSLNGSSSGHRARRADINHNSQGSVDTEPCARPESRLLTSIAPQDDDIEKSFRVNEDGSMTVEMKVRLTIKEEEMIHWTTTLRRSNLSNRQRTACASKPGSVNGSPDSNNTLLKDSTAGEDETKEDNRRSRATRGVAFSKEGGYDSCVETAADKSSLKRTPTPGVSKKKKASVESVKVVTENGVQESTTGTYCYTERNADGEMTEGYCVVRQNTSSSRPVPKPRQTPSAGPRCNVSPSPLKSSRIAEVLQLQGDGMEITETVMHIYEGQGCYDNYFANSQYVTEGGSENTPRSEPASTDTGPRSSSNDCDVDFTRQSSSTDSKERGRKEILSLSSEPVSPVQKISNNLSSFTDNEAHITADSQTDSLPKDVECLKSGSEKTPGKVEKKKKTVKAKPKFKNPTSTTSSSEKKRKDNVASSSKSTKNNSSPDKSSTSGKKSGTGTESDKNSPKTEKVKKKKLQTSGDETTNTRNKGLVLNIENVNGKSSKKQLNMNKKGARESLLNVNTPDAGGVRMKKNMSNILPPKPVGKGKKKLTKQKSMNENRLASPKLNSEMSESVSMPALPSAQSDAHEYVENWLQKITAEPVPYVDDLASAETENETKVVFRIGADSESEVKAEESQDSTGDGCLPHEDIQKSMSCLSVPVSYEAPSLNIQTAQRKGLCISMPSVRIDPKEQEARLRMHKSTTAIVVESESPSTTNHLSPTGTLGPVLRQLCSSIQSFRRTSVPDNVTSLEKSSSMPDFSTQVASVFGSPSKALLSFLSVRTLRESLKGSEDDSRSGSEALLVMESLQKISAIEDEEELRASLSDLQSRTSSQLRQSWRDFQERQDMLESQPLSPKFSEQEFALDVVSEVGEDHSRPMSEIEELLKELAMPQELREQLTSLVGAGSKMYPQYDTDVSCAETLKHRRHSDSEEEVEVFAGEHEEASELEAGPEDTDVTPAVQEEKGSEHSSVEPDKGNIQHNADEDLVAREEGNTDMVQNSERRIESDEEGLTDADMTESNRSECVDCRSTTADRQEKLSLKSGSDQGKSDADVGSLTEAGYSAEEDTDPREAESPAKQSDDDIKVCEEREEEEEGEETQDEGEDGDGTVEHEDEGEGGEGVEQERVEEDEDLGSEADDVEAEEEVNQMEEVEVEDDDREEEGYIEEDEEMQGNESEPEDRGERWDDEEREGKREEEEESEEKGEGEREEDGEGEREEVEEEGAEENEDKMETREEEEGEEDERVEDEGGNSETQEDRREADEMEENKEEEEEKAGGGQSEGGERDDECEDEEGKGEREGETQENEEERDEGCGCSAESDLENSVKVHAITNTLEEGSYMEQKSSCEEGENSMEEAETKRSENRDLNSGSNNSSPEIKELDEGCCQDTDTANERKTEGEEDEEDDEECNHNTTPHPVEISQELIDFVNSALMSSSLTFTYDSKGNIRIEPDNARIVPSQGMIIPPKRKDSQYGKKRLLSPNTSDLSDYRPETSESGGYKSQASTELSTESGEETSQSHSSVHGKRTSYTSNKGLNRELTPSKISKGREAEIFIPGLKSGGGLTSHDSNAKASAEDLSYSSAGSSNRPDPEPVKGDPLQTDVDSADGVLIDRGRWLLKENHLIRKSPPISMGMYSNLDNTSVDTAQSHSSEDVPHHHRCANQHSPLAVLSSSELEEMAKPTTPNCTYYNMPHGSDSDPFLDDLSLASRRENSRMKRDIKVSPTVDTSKTWVKKNGSMSSFASVEFKMADGKVHPEGARLALEQPSRSQNVVRRALSSQDSIESLHLRCGEYCPIL